jgi:hypothetical protein
MCGNLLSRSPIRTKIEQPRTLVCTSTNNFLAILVDLSINIAHGEKKKPLPLSSDN